MWLHNKNARGKEQKNLWTQVFFFHQKLGVGFSEIYHNAAAATIF